MTLLEKNTERYFVNEGRMCSEAVLAALKEEFRPDMPEEILRAASAFGGGMGGSGCVCGALTAGSMALGLILGRTDPSQSPALVKAASARLQAFFRQRYGVTCCRKLSRDFATAADGKKARCTEVCLSTVNETARLIREYESVL